MKNTVWVVRGNPEGMNREKQFLDQGYIGIGWNKCGSFIVSNSSQVEDVIANEKEIKEALTNHYYSEKSDVRKCSSAYYQVIKFVKQMLVGDLVVLPSEGVIHVGEITTDYYFKEIPEVKAFGKIHPAHTPVDPHRRNVKWLGHFNRGDLSIDFRRALSVRRTVADISSSYDEIQGLLHGRKTERTITLEVRTGFTTSIRVPSDFTKNEAERLARRIAVEYTED